MHAGLQAFTTMITDTVLPRMLLKLGSIIFNVGWHLYRILLMILIRVDCRLQADTKFVLQAATSGCTVSRLPDGRA